jgi:hypothetical protein
MNTSIATTLNRQRKGSALLAVIAVSAIVLLAVSTLIAFSHQQRDNLSRERIRQRETFVAESIVDAAASRVMFAGRYRGEGLGGAYSVFHSTATQRNRG